MIKERALRYVLVLALLLPLSAYAQSPPPTDIAGYPHRCDAWYPPALQRAGVEGITEISFHIMTSGRVKRLAVVNSSGNDELDRAAERCAATWLYKPATQDGKPIEVPSTAKIIWQLPEIVPASPAPSAPPN